jgi:NADPH:quinone reductase-like Zn-dependent oxidoreductase
VLVKAVLHTAYGPPSELQLQELDKPKPEAHEVLIKIHASSVTSSDCNVRNQTFVPQPFRYLARMEFGFPKPKINLIGFDLAGVIEDVGQEVNRFQVGDQIFGTTEPAYGAHAEYICLPQDGVIAHKPANMTFEEAATIPVIGNTALHFVRDLGGVQAGHKVLINGASGGIGTFAVQIAKQYGAHVTGVCSSANINLVKSLGADEVIDYTKDDFTKNQAAFDVIFDAVGKSSFSRCRRALTETGIYLDTLPKISTFVHVAWTSRFGTRKARMEGAPAKLDNLLDLKELVEAEKLSTIIDRRYPIEQIVEAFEYVEGGHKRGHVVINIV